MGTLKSAIVESLDLDIERHVQKNLETVKANMKTYGWNLKEDSDEYVGKIDNYYDLANLLDYDSRDLKDADIKQMAEVVADQLEQAMEEGLS